MEVPPDLALTEQYLEDVGTQLHIDVCYVADRVYDKAVVPFCKLHGLTFSPTGELQFALNTTAGDPVIEYDGRLWVVEPGATPMVRTMRKLTGSGELLRLLLLPVPWSEGEAILLQYINRSYPEPVILMLVEPE